MRPTLIGFLNMSLVKSIESIRKHYKYLKKEDIFQLVLDNDIFEHSSDLKIF